MIRHPELQKEALYYLKRDNKSCICQLCPRTCKINEGRKGYCGTRENREGVLYAINYGQSLELTQEVIETEAVYLRDPGTPILSIGNIGCNMSCDFCQNWNTSQMKYIKEGDYREITPETIIKEAIRRNISILSWTYNDPVVWQEFVVETAEESKKYGLRNLYKSAFYINEKPVEDLLQVIDIFSISLKSMDKDFYTKYCKTSLPPVLERIKQVYKAHAYLELSNLVVTGRNDTIKHVRDLVNWVLTELDENIPVHFVAFHPAYKYINSVRTPESFLRQAQQVALEMGLKYVNVGNVFNAELATLYCQNCHEILLKRHGLYTEFHNLHSKDGKFFCPVCHVRVPLQKDIGTVPEELDFYQPNINKMNILTYHWSSESVTLHLRGLNTNESVKYAFFQHKMKDGSLTGFTKVPFYPDEPWRFLIQKYSDDDQEVILYYDSEVNLQILNLLDRAHYPNAEEKVCDPLSVK